MNKNIIYVRAADDWSKGVFAIHHHNSWRFVYWNYADTSVEPTFTESAILSAYWARNILLNNDTYPVYQEYEYNGKSPL